jgi:outer membrane immunogenic protein
MLILLENWGLMSRLSVAFIAAVSAIAVTQVASAADIPVKAPVTKAPIAAPPYDWTGVYVGGYLGYLWGRTRVEDNGVVTEPGAKTDGVIGGVLTGANWQNGPVVLGLEGDFGWIHAHGVGAVALPDLPNTYDLNWTSHVRGRGGYAFDNWLFFVAGGLAIADLDFHEGGRPSAPPAASMSDGRSAAASNAPSRVISWAASNICTTITATRITSAWLATCTASR